jgi:hypothetical protein
MKGQIAFGVLESLANTELLSLAELFLGSLYPARLVILKRKEERIMQERMIETKKITNRRRGRKGIQEKGKNGRKGRMRR